MLIDLSRERLARVMRDLAEAMSRKEIGGADVLAADSDGSLLIVSTFRLI